MGDVTSYAFLKSKVPAPFVQEWSGGAGKHIHHKFVVVDFNDSNPIVFTGSSNLSAGGEVANGDNLVMINDPTIASIYAIEAVRLFDHYSFRQSMQKATSNAPLTLWYPGKPGAPSPWWTAYYEPTNIKLRDRCLFAEVALPPGLKTVKNVDWSSIDSAAPAKRRLRLKRTSSRG
jgi:phosphatidylserine/phosphatidylglycerophosphate/cardiolipin synthase-like enzyme